jgi:hypothetical protein
MCIAQQPKMSREEFRDYWMNKNNPRFIENAGALRANKYVQSHTVVTPLSHGLRSSSGMLTEHVRVAEVWFESKEGLMEGMNSPESQKCGFRAV